MYPADRRHASKATTDWLTLGGSAKCVVHERFLEASAQRGWAPTSRAAYEADTAFGGALLVGEPGEIAERILHMHARWRHVRQFVHMDGARFRRPSTCAQSNCSVRRWRSS